MNSPVDYTGARGSNAGDEFHILWVLKHCLSLLNPNSNLSTISIEDPSPEDIKHSRGKDLLLGIDCAFYYGAQSFAESSRVQFSQLKYSPSDPNKKWTPARFIASKTTNKNSSLIKRLADIFRNYKDHSSNTEWSIALVTNQPIANDIQVIVKRSGGKVAINSDITTIPETKITDVYNRLKKASELDDELFPAFLGKLDFSECGGLSRFVIEERIWQELAALSESEPGSHFNRLFRHIYKLTLPEGTGQYITKEGFITWLGLSSKAALFPAPSEIKIITDRVTREGAQEIVRKITSNQMLCLHGHGGYGKTTLLQEIEEKLPQDSIAIIYDCYGGGTYLNSDKTRHRSQDAFTQLSNTLAVETNTANFLIPSSNTNYPKAFMTRLYAASKLLFSLNEQALLFIVIDAADNAIIAAQKTNDSDCFIRDIITLSALPNNVRILLTCRTGRIDSLNLPPEIEKVSLPEFTEEETKLHLNINNLNATQQIVQDFHHLSRGIPRVQAYAIGYANGSFDKLLSLLRPKGKNLDDLFEYQLQEANIKAGTINIQEMVTILIELPRPIPVMHLANIAAISDGTVLDICSDLSPGIKVIDDEIEFADEDFEEFIRQKAQESGFIENTQQKIANYLWERRNNDSYAAFHVADALVIVNRTSDLLSIIDNELTPEIINDILLKHQVVTRRLALGLLCCEDAGSHAAAFRILLSAAEALKTEKAFYQLLIDNPEVAAIFAEDAIEKSILQNKEYSYGHGPIRFHKALLEAKQNQAPLARQSLRWAYEWIRTRYHLDDREKSEWKFSETDAAAGIETTLYLGGAQQALGDLLKWRPKRYGEQIGLVLIERLYSQGKISEIVEISKLENLPPRWLIAILVPLLLTNQKVQSSLIREVLIYLAKLPKWKINKLTYQHNDYPYEKILDLTLLFLELAAKRKIGKKLILQALAKIVPKEMRVASQIFMSAPITLDVRIRACALQETLGSKAESAEKELFADIQDPDEKGIANQERQDRLKKSENNKEKEEITKLLLPGYQTRLLFLLNEHKDIQLESFIKEQIATIKNNNWRFRDHWFSRVITRFVESLAVVVSFQNDNVAKVAHQLVDLVNWNDGDYLGGRRISILRNFTHLPLLHDFINQSVNNFIAPDIRKFSAPASEKATAFVECAELLLHINLEDAQCYFEEAIEITKQIDEDAFDQIRLLDKLSCYSKALEFPTKRECAHNIGMFIADAAIKLSNFDDFPWQEGVRAVTQLDPPIAIATIGRWHDRELASLVYTFKAFLKCALENSVYTPQVATCLAAILTEASSSIAHKIAEQSSKLSLPEHYKLGQVLAQDTLLNARLENRLKYGNKLLSYYSPDKITERLLMLSQTTIFIKNMDENQNLSIDKERVTSFEFAGKDYTDISTIKDTLSTLQQEVYDHSWIFAKIREHVAVVNRVNHINAVIQLADRTTLKTLIPQILTEWSDSPSIVKWAKTELPLFISENLPKLSVYIRYNPSELELLLESTGLKNSDLIRILLEGIRKSPSNFDSFSLYGLLGIMSKYLTSEDAKTSLLAFVGQLTKLTDCSEDSALIISNVPSDIVSASGRFLYGLLGDTDKQVRWRAVHTLRRFATLNEADFLRAVIHNINREEEPEFRASELPFYWMAARQWLLVALERISHEMPEMLLAEIDHIKGCALDNNFPHIAIKRLSQEILIQLIKEYPGCLDANTINDIQLLTTSPFQKVTGNRYQQKEIRDDSRANRRFLFNSLDTLPSWYSPAARMFKAPETFSFLDRAEFWIGDKWKVITDPGKWLNEPRKHFQSMKFASHSHRGKPRVERWSCHLEYHAMMCGLSTI